jgi:hypothetical protein
MKFNGENVVLRGAALLFAWLAVQAGRAASKNLGADPLLIGGLVALTAHLLPKAE